MAENTMADRSALFRGATRQVFQGRGYSSLEQRWNSPNRPTARPLFLVRDNGTGIVGGSEAPAGEEEVEEKGNAFTARMRRILEGEDAGVPFEEKSAEPTRCTS